MRRRIAGILSTTLVTATALAPLPAAGQADTAAARDTAAADTAATPRSGTFKALTYNVAGLPPGVSKSKPLQNIPRISALLNGYDLVLVQEDFVFHALLEYAVNLPHRSEAQGLSRLFSRDFLALVRDFPQINIDRILALAGGERMMGDGLNHFSRFPFTDFERQRWTICSGVTAASNDCLATKGFTYGRHTLAEGVTVDVYNVHADAGRRPWDEEARRAQFRQLAAFMALRSAGQAVLVAGDTNLQAPVKADEETLQEFMKATGLSIAGRTLGAGDEVDRFFYRGGTTLRLEPVAQSPASEFVDPDGRPLSDHPALRVDFRWEVIPAGGAPQG
jgi:endonuclease/exonuclease/phosphatase family metal-dependent hydrolase